MSGLYIHIPFCEHKCIYCDFYSIESLDAKNDFLQALRSEIDMYASTFPNERFETIFFGGGTPSLLAPEEIAGLLRHLADTFTVQPDAEVTLETNPGTVDQKKLEGFRNAGINRLSFGVQSFFDNDLKFLTRIHSADQARQAVRFARKAGFGNINLDLIFALPNQTMSRWEQNLHFVLELEPQHISAYSLIVERGTPLFRMVEAKIVSPQPVETEAAMYEITMKNLHDAGFEHYEVSNYAQPGFRSRHNCTYWDHSHYVGFGPSAHSFVRGKRWWNVSNIRTYCEKLEQNRNPVSGSELLTPSQLYDEAIMLGLRSNGIDL
ncbi:MAG TPA: radical SAM family heme chaperone HemW, partial [Bacteroidota bacterium]|nr:radical SAM family heme chaperone HemW [Bacteroidota bacterium]